MKCTSMRVALSAERKAMHSARYCIDEREKCGPEMRSAASESD
jgi:hypothetical protein